MFWIIIIIIIIITIIKVHLFFISQVMFQLFIETCWRCEQFYKMLNQFICASELGTPSMWSNLKFLISYFIYEEKSLSNSRALNKVL